MVMVSNLDWWEKRDGSNKQGRLVRVLDKCIKENQVHNSCLVQRRVSNLRYRNPNDQTMILVGHSFSIQSSNNSIYTQN